MEKRITLLAVIFIVVGLSSSVALALVPMGPPRATLKEGQLAVGFEYGRQEMDLKTYGEIKEVDAAGTVVEQTTYSHVKYKINGLTSNMFLGNLSYGMLNNWDIYGRLGVADVECDEIMRIFADGSTPNRYQGLDSTYGFAWGFGTKATFGRDGDIVWGGLFQFTRSNPDGSSINLLGDPNFTGEAEIDYYEIQLAVGPTLQLDDVSIYGGPFVHFVRGDLDISGGTEEDVYGPATIEISAHDILEKSQFGGYVGVNLNATDNASLYAEYQFTADAWAFGLGTLLKID